MVWQGVCLSSSEDSVLSYVSWSQSISGLTSGTHRRLGFGDSVLLWAPTGQNRPISVWRGPYRIVGRLGNDEYRVEISPGKAKTCHVNLLKKYYCEQRLIQPVSFFHEGRQMNNSPRIFC